MKLSLKFELLNKTLIHLDELPSIYSVQSSFKWPDIPGLYFACTTPQHKFRRIGDSFDFTVFCGDGKEGQQVLNFTVHPPKHTGDCINENQISFRDDRCSGEVHFRPLNIILEQTFKVYPDIIKITKSDLKHLPMEIKYIGETNDGLLQRTVINKTHHALTAMLVSKIVRPDWQGKDLSIALMALTDDSQNELSGYNIPIKDALLCVEKAIILKLKPEFNIKRDKSSFFQTHSNVSSLEVSLPECFNFSAVSTEPTRNPVDVDTRRGTMTFTAFDSGKKLNLDNVFEVDKEDFLDLT